VGESSHMLTCGQSSVSSSQVRSERTRDSPSLLYLVKVFLSAAAGNTIYGGSSSHGIYSALSRDSEIGG